MEPLKPIKSLDDAASPQDTLAGPRQKPERVWVTGLDERGHERVIGPFDDEGEAMERAGDLNQIKTYRLRTDSLDSAKEMIRARVLANTGSATDAFKRLFRQKPTAQEDTMDAPASTSSSAPQPRKSSGNLFHL